MTETPIPSGKYGVVQSSEEVEERIYSAMIEREFAEVDLQTELGARPVRFRVRTTDHDDKGALIIGVTSDDRTINLHLFTNEEVTATIT